MKLYEVGITVKRYGSNRPPALHWFEVKATDPHAAIARAKDIAAASLLDVSGVTTVKEKIL